ncbi:family 10 glycosylhydrolase [Mucilaginibacter myungsuensis]
MAQSPSGMPPLPEAGPAPKREFRAVWVATVANIDWPSSSKLPVERQKQELLNLLDFDHNIGINAVMFQVRPAADAFYAKGKEPWSKWLNGTQGHAPIPFYDPLQMAITESHKRGIELHAWFNPYRATLDANFNALAPDHITRLKPEWFMVYGGIKLFNPGIPEVREYIVQTLLNVVDNYDIDGVHMDDYFYPYRIAGQTIKDAETFKQYGGAFASIDDWRRDNVDQLIHMLGDSIHKHKPNMKFGISPMGIWANKSQHPEGSDTRGGSAYVELYADSRKWSREGWIDYINPQLYWNFGYRLAAYETLVDWWSNNAYGRHLYIGQAAYRIGDPKQIAFRSPSQLPDQIKYLRNNPRVQGSVFFSQKSLQNNLLGIADSLRTKYYNHPALPPVMLWLDSVGPKQPTQLMATSLAGKVTLRWNAPLPANDNEPTYGYVIYRYTGDEKVDTERPESIVGIRYDTSLVFEDKTTERGKKYIYIVTALDRMKNESEHSEPVTVVAN